MLCRGAHPKDIEIKLRWERGDRRDAIARALNIEYRHLCHHINRLIAAGAIAKRPLVKGRPWKIVSFGVALRAQRLGLNPTGSARFYVADDSHIPKMPK